MGKDLVKRNSRGGKRMEKSRTVFFFLLTVDYNWAPGELFVIWGFSPTVTLCLHTAGVEIIIHWTASGQSSKGIVCIVLVEAFARALGVFPSARSARRGVVPVGSTTSKQAPQPPGCLTLCFIRKSNCRTLSGCLLSAPKGNAALSAKTLPPNRSDPMQLR